MKTFFTYPALTFIALLLTPQTITAQCHIDDWTALKVFYENTTNWQKNVGWSETFTNHNTPPEDCNLEDVKGISLNEHGRVKGVSLFTNDIIGSLPAEIGLLTELENITMYGNQLSGPIPPEIGNLKKLTTIWLSDNQISGSIPIEISTLPGLVFFRINNNRLSGPIPPQLGNLSKLDYLNLEGNDLSGPIPSELGNLSNLTYLGFRGNQLTGPIPPGLVNLTHLTTLNLAENQLSGEIPKDLGDLTLLEILFLNNNNLTGNLPTWVGEYSELFNINITNNQLSGCYHPNIASLCNSFSSTNNRISNGNNFNTSWEDFCETNNGVCELEGEEVIIDCTDTEACNYNPNANYENGSCTYYDIKIDCPCGTIAGCSDPNANNYNAFADCDNGFCEYDNTLQPGEELIFYPWISNIVSSSNCQDVEVLLIFGTGYYAGRPSYVYINSSEGGALYLINGRFLCADYTEGETLCVDQYARAGFVEDRWVCSNFTLTPGCNNPSACNYNADAQTDDGSCEYGNTNCNTPCNAIVGCTEETALNYNPDANCEDYSCEYDNPLCHIDDWTALKALFESTNMDPLYNLGGIFWNDTTGWEEINGIVPSANCNLANLFGISLGSDGRVDSIKLSSNGLYGSIPRELENLSSLRYLSLDRNFLFYGSIPAELGNLSNLEYLSLAYIAFTFQRINWKNSTSIR